MQCCAGAEYMLLGLMLTLTMRLLTCWWADLACISAGWAAWSLCSCAGESCASQEGWPFPSAVQKVCLLVAAGAG